MEQSGPINEQYQALFKKVVLSHYPLHAVAEVEALSDKYFAHQDHDEIKLRCESLISAIYSFNNFPDRSLSIDLSILKTLPTHHPIYYVVINRAAKTSETSGRQEELLPFVLNYLNDPGAEFYKILFILQWYVQHYQDRNPSLLNYEPLLASITAQMGMIPDGTKTFSERVGLLVSEFHRGDKTLHALKVAFRDEPKEGFAKVLDDYLAKEPIGYFRDQAMCKFRII
ncbi:hypothetical protein [Mucilaginibacter terrae]|uniref:Uncharacterized protein n=1 Tax=Mucilaginibacter terrae TaxID=1955052 RepID=A0ABU3GN61_9SPHI|nr:hypothetical protein [Mucilaginibacter terrae]MDT3401206.1 hypothetical protein [Mucilaginibacter terrae]